MAAQVIELKTPDNCFLQLVMWLENTRYFGMVFMLDIDFETYGVTLYGGETNVESFREELAKGIEYIKNNWNEEF